MNFDIGYWRKNHIKFSITTTGLSLHSY